ncbi:MAG: endonuclease [Nitrospirae bacterium CG_4_9_14_3_um_filter_53_35]|nr:MAG: endonuclease [Nitrospirae bacterium CG2_30_53_67]PIS37762.1 MAG: endonuclease [Nitrospirae bacterium CG08_land_8_20_14_0_20_52_24]PIV85782.1 MAG: endonuclease [Nitrospirae bacterium CG17_big_fil_post_rev_8_21_14_2_50_50_9]PJA73022.1 MAG: endonuclease [Nitrospirae bacterium CG_4_9_14_3_um_filter_53_35]
MKRNLAQRLLRIYKILYAHYGPQHWWPADSRFEVIVGAILTQNTNWKNVEKAITNLKAEGILSPQALHKVSRQRLSRLIRSSGYFNIKTDRLKSFMDFMMSGYGGDLKAMFRGKTEILREKLLNIKGIGPETADSILLYAAGRPVFVVDAYTRRVLSRHGLCEDKASYHQIQSLFMENLAPDVRMFNEYHALLVSAGKRHCTSKPVCSGCPLQGY